MLSLDCPRPGAGAGSALIAEVVRIAREAGAKRLIVVTTSDNTDAMRFYQRRGFSLIDVRFDAVTRSREVKPEIPLIGESGIPIRHEMVFRNGAIIMFRILVVEDNANAQADGRGARAARLRDGLAADGVEALEILDKKHVDLILLDIMMPRMDGYEFTEILRANRALGEIPILMVTAKETPADKRKGFIIGTDDYLVKPVDEEEMILRIAALLRRSRIVNEQPAHHRRHPARLRLLLRQLRRIHLRAPPQGVPPALQAALLPQQDLHPAASSWTRSGTWTRTPTSAPSTSTSTACAGATHDQPAISKSPRCGAWGYKGVVG